MKPNFLLLMLLICCLQMQAQEQNPLKLVKPVYKTAAGFKFFPAAITIKNNTSSKSALEFLGYFKDGFRLTVLSEHHGRLNKDGNMRWYIGGGGHVGLTSKEKGGSAKIGVDGVIGLDYKFLHLPLNITLDWQPSLGLGDESNFTSNWGGIGLRYCF